MNADLWNKLKEYLLLQYDECIEEWEDSYDEEVRSAADAYKGVLEKMEELEGGND